MTIKATVNTQLNFPVFGLTDKEIINNSDKIMEDVCSLIQQKINYKLETKLYHCEYEIGGIHEFIEKEPFKQRQIYPLKK